MNHHPIDLHRLGRRTGVPSTVFVTAADPACVDYVVFFIRGYMKRVVAVLLSFSSRTAPGAGVLLFAVATYIAMYGAFYLQTRGYSFSTGQDLHVGSSDQDSNAANSRELLLVSSIIKAAIPDQQDSSRLALLIVTESKSAGVDPLLVTAIIKAESMFKSRAVSNRGARGLMQLMPKTGEYVSALENRSQREKIDLHDPTTNLRLGIAYLKYLESKFAGDRHQALIAYNWGPTNLVKALRGKRSLPQQSVKYAHKVLSHHGQWKTSLDTQEPLSDASAIG